MSGSATKLQPLELPIRDVPVVIDRTRRAVEIEPARIELLRPNAENSPQLRWIVEGELLPDELLVIFGKRQCWTGSFGPAPERLPVVDAAFPTPLELGPGVPHVLSGPPTVELDPKHSSLLWLYGVVLIRGRDKPWIGEAQLRLDIIEA